LSGPVLLAPLVDRALRRAADAHRHQTRKGTDHPYVQHPAAVALILARLGYGEPVLAAALLHDVVEDTAVPLDSIRSEFGDEVAALVDWCTERKRDAAGAMRPWAERKAEQLDRLDRAPADARAIVLADKLHNLTSIAVDLADGVPVWDRFNAPRAESLRHHREVATRLMSGDERLAALGRECLRILEELEGSR
jgi:(p)ppGpp synthase/HD superfamily hydrolase